MSVSLVACHERLVTKRTKNRRRVVIVQAWSSRAHFRVVPGRSLCSQISSFRPGHFRLPVLCSQTFFFWKQCKAFSIRIAMAGKGAAAIRARVTALNDEEVDVDDTVRALLDPLLRQAAQDPDADTSQVLLLHPNPNPTPTLTPTPTPNPNTCTLHPNRNPDPDPNPSPNTKP